MTTMHQSHDFTLFSLRTVSIKIHENNCCFLRVERDEYRRILISVEENTVKIKENGKEAMLLERSAAGRWVWSVGVVYVMVIVCLQVSCCDWDAAKDAGLSCTVRIRRRI